MRKYGLLVEAGVLCTLAFAIIAGCGDDNDDSERRACYDQGGTVIENASGWYAGCLVP